MEYRASRFRLSQNIVQLLIAHKVRHEISRDGGDVAIVNEVTDGQFHIIWRIKPLLIEIVNMKLYRNELETIIIWNHDADWFTGEFYNLLLHMPTPATARLLWLCRMNFEMN
ncbi:hypothetical protein D3C80_1633310 [compost metagenome]